MTGFRVTGLAKLGNDAAGHTADVRAAVPADVGLVADATQGDADERSAHRFGDRLTQRSFAHARWADKAQDRARAADIFFADVAVDDFFVGRHGHVGLNQR